ncbi:ATP-binding protein [Paraburkholderia phytofirmans]|jgi:hypothetical protein|uniref:AlbA family DNA-binding domain-containing protein n=1 Tax=Paraburkholderia phytofirmans TaxID=261302 RepID=UPI0038B864CF
MFPTIDDSIALIRDLSEGYAVEVKSWFDPSTPQGKAKLVKALIALRNNDGGRLVVGFDDDTMRPVDQGRPGNLREAFGQDAIQSSVSRYASEPFEVQVQYVERDGQHFPVICVPGGVRTPVATKSEIKDGSTTFLPMHVVYVRTLNANNTVSTASAKYQDWNRVCSHCFDNREADIGQFVRRHLNSTALNSLMAALQLPDSARPSVPSDQSREWIEKGRAAFEARLRRDGLKLEQFGSLDVGGVIIGEVAPLVANQSMLNLIRTANRRFTGFPFYTTLESADEKQRRPNVIADAWERSYVTMDARNGLLDTVDFWRVEPAGRLYTLRSYDEDVNEQTASQHVLSITTPIWRAGDALAETLAIARAMAVDPSSAQLVITFRWTNLTGRRLSNAFTNRMFSMRATSTDDVVSSSIEVPLDLPDSAMADRIGEILAPLYRAFEGTEMPQFVVQEEIQKMLSRTY